jgi:hypothetical protein
MAYEKVMSNLNNWLTKVEGEAKIVLEKTRAVESLIYNRINILKKHITQLKTPEDMEKQILNIVDGLSEIDKLVNKLKDINSSDPLHIATKSIDQFGKIR